MLGWEFPPFISGGLGTACFGLTRALSKQDTQVIFVLPRDVPGNPVSHVRLLTGERRRAELIASGQSSTELATILGHADFSQVTLRTVDAKPISPYQSAGGTFHSHETVTGRRTIMEQKIAEMLAPIGALGLGPQPPGRPAIGAHYDGDLIAETKRYAALCLALARSEKFDVIHAHDWMTFPAGLAVASVTGKPLVIHVHSTEFDRSGDHVNQPVYDIERRGMHGATRIIAVSHLTRSVIQHRYGIHPDKVEVIYNGVENGSNGSTPVQPRSGIARCDKIVLFLGRITMQKGPEYFVAAAKKVLEKYDKVKFVMAGSGDKVTEIIDLAASEGIGHKVLFTGFLRGPDVQRIFRMADVYVMPSVSEPFGIAPLEAITQDVPVIISKTSGVAEVLTHALKVDFWDTHEIANKIIAVLRHPPLSSTLREHADMEVRSLTWDGAASRCNQAYQRAINIARM